MNKQMLERQKVTPAQKARLEVLYKKLDKLFKVAEKSKGDKTILQKVARDVKELEFEMQDNWNFPRDESRHSYWFRIPHCKCPKMDNKERFGVSEKIFTCGCPIHWGEEVGIEG